MAFTPGVVETNLQVPAATGAVQVAPLPSETTTLPVRVPVIGDSGTDVQLTSIPCPTRLLPEAIDAAFVMVVTVGALFTVRVPLTKAKL